MMRSSGSDCETWLTNGDASAIDASSSSCERRAKLRGRTGSTGSIAKKGSWFASVAVAGVRLVHGRP